MFNKLPKHSGIYQIRDKIDELEIEINFRHVHSLLKLPNYEITAKGFKFDGKEPNTGSGGENSFTTTRIKWQQKLLSPKETQKKYNKLLNAAEESGRNKSKRRGKKSTRGHKSMTKTPIINEIFTYVQDDNFLAEEEKINQNSKTNSMKPVSMYIYAAISPDTDTQLVALKWYAEQRLLYIYPDFNDIYADPYFIGIDSNYRHLYAYAVSNVSVSRLESIKEHNVIILPELQTIATHWETERDLNEQFQMPPKNMKRVVLLFEIRTACCGFAYQPMHVRYHVHLPEHCLLEEGLAEGSTHSSFALSTPNSCSHAQGTCNNCYHYGYNFQLTILCEHSCSSAMLHIYFELISIDNWERERLEGYAHYSTYLTKAGREIQELQCLRLADNLLDQLTRYFIGGRRKFDYVQFFTPPKNAKIVLHNRFECRMINSGHLHITCQKIIQRNCELLSPCKNRGMTLDDILRAYIQARQRLEALVLD